MTEQSTNFLHFLSLSNLQEVKLLICSPLSHVMSVMTFETNQQMLVNKIESVDGQGYNNNKGTVANIINQVFLISVSLLLLSVTLMVPLQNTNIHGLVD